MKNRKKKFLINLEKYFEAVALMMLLMVGVVATAIKPIAPADIGYYADFVTPLIIVLGIILILSNKKRKAW